MAFKSIGKKEKNYSDIESLFRDLPTKGVESLYSHQADIIRYYQNNALNETNVAIELPTGSGKTLVGLLIAEFRRRKYGEKVLYLCPTRQLVNQVVEISNSNYGINCISFTGSHKNYEDIDKFKYKNGDAIAVSTYSSLFNINPWFEEPDLIILDDAHTSENYIASCWSLSISRKNDPAAYRALIDTIKDSIPYSVHNRLTDSSVDPMDKKIVEKFPGHKFYNKNKEIFEILSEYLNDHHSLKYSWLMIKDHLEACQLYYSWNEIMIRPLIPPSLDNLQFRSSKQRILMSATLGQGGDLERITGIKKFHKIPIPPGWDKQGMGRRFFMFPTLSLDQKNLNNLFSGLIKGTKRSVILVSTEEEIEDFRSEFKKHVPDWKFFTALDIEKSKSEFIKSDKAVIVLANRFDGIDFAGDQSRLLFLMSIPYASNLQERFLQSRMDASIIFYDRNRTRLIQAIGRCTRSPKDFSAICVVGDKDLSEWLLLRNKNKFLHPELQAELEFGINNSKNIDLNEYLENFDDFINQTDDWKIADKEIIDLRNEKIQENFPGSEVLENIAPLEVELQYFIWNKDFEKAFLIVTDIIEKLDGGKELKGYRAFWHYQAAVISHILWQKTKSNIFKQKSEDYFEKLIRICPSASWSRLISESTSEVGSADLNLISNIEHLQDHLTHKNIGNKKSYRKYLHSIESHIETKNLENLNLEIGNLLGFVCKNPAGEAAPDPYWISANNYVLVFEDKMYDNEEGEISIAHIRQANSHKTWIKENIKSLEDNCTIVTIIISNRKRISSEAAILSDNLYYWNYQNFTEFSREIISLAREYAIYYSGENDHIWKEFFIDEFIKKKLTPKQIINLCSPLIDLSKAQ